MPKFFLKGKRGKPVIMVLIVMVPAHISYICKRYIFQAKQNAAATWLIRRGMDQQVKYKVQNNVSLVLLIQQNVFSISSLTDGLKQKIKHKTNSKPRILKSIWSSVI